MSNELFIFKERLADLESDLAQPELLKQIHQQIKGDPTLLTIISDEEISTIVSAMCVAQGAAFATTSKKKAAADHDY